LSEITRKNYKNVKKITRIIEIQKIIGIGGLIFEKSYDSILSVLNELIQYKHD